MESCLKTSGAWKRRSAISYETIPSTPLRSEGMFQSLTTFFQTAKKPAKISGFHMETPRTNWAPIHWRSCLSWSREMFKTLILENVQPLSQVFDIYTHLGFTKAVEYMNQITWKTWNWSFWGIFVRKSNSVFSRFKPCWVMICVFKALEMSGECSSVRFRKDSTSHTQRGVNSNCGCEPRRFSRKSPGAAERQIRY